MKILFYNHTGQVSGAERVLLMILEGLDRQSFEPSVVCPEQGPLREMTAAAGVPTKTLNGLEARFTWRPGRLFRYLRSFFQVIRAFRQTVITLDPDLIHANSVRAGLVASAATFDLGTPVVWHLHDLLPRHPLSSAIRFFAACSTRTRMIAVSEAVAGNFRGRLARVFGDRVAVVLNAIDLSKFPIDKAAKQRFREELKLNGDRPVVGIVGQLTPRKGQLELIRAFARSLDQAPHAMLLIVGAPLFNRDHEYAARLKDEVEALGIGDRVRLMGARSDVASVMQSLDLLAINSAAEPFGLVALEAMACGTPVLAGAVDGLKEIIRHNENGWLFPRLDEESLAKAIVSLGQEPELCARLAEQGRLDVASHFSVDRYMEELQAFYRRRDLKPESKGAGTEPAMPFVLQVSREVGLRGGSESVAFQLHRAWMAKGIDSRAVTSIATEPDAREGISFTLERLTRWITASRWRHLPALFVVPLFTLVATWKVWRTRGRKIVLSHGDSLTGDVCIVHALNSASLREKRLTGNYRWLLNPSNLWFELRDRWMLGGERYRRIVAISESVRRELKERYGVRDDRIAMIPNGIDTSRFNPENVAGRAAVRREFGIAENARLVLFVGSQYGLKGLEFTIKALAQMRTEVSLLVVGNDDSAPYAELAEQLDLGERVIFAGARSDLPNIYPASDAFVLPSLYETFALVCLEAMASGTPVLATAVGGIEDYLQDGRNGLFIERDESDIAAKLDRLFSDDDLSARLRAGGLAMVKAYTWGAIAEKYLGLFNEVIEEKREKENRTSRRAQFRTRAFEVR